VFIKHTHWNEMAITEKFTALHFMNVFVCFIYMPSVILWCSFMVEFFILRNLVASVCWIFKYVIV